MNPEIKRRIAHLFTSPFVSSIGVRFMDAGDGWCETTLPVVPTLTQHTGVAHAGALATLADHTSGAAAFTLMQPDDVVLTVEFKINLLRPAHRQSMRCRAEVLKPGRMFHVVEACVFAVNDGKETLVAKMMATMAAVKAGG
jgi:uncharacterized protein (TIGR00369 family)